MSELTHTESEVLRFRLAPWMRLAVVPLIAGAATALVPRRFKRPRAPARLGGLAALFVAALVFAPTASGQASGPEFADWTAAGANVASGTLQGQPISLSGSHVSSAPASTVDGSSTVFAESYFSPPLPRSDALEFRGWPGYSYVLRFGAPTKDPVLHLASLASTLRFPGGTSITRLSGENDSFKVSASSVSGALDGPNDANGTVRLNGVFESISFSAEPAQPLIQPDGIYIQVGAPPPPEPPPPPVDPPGALDYSIYTVYKHPDGTLVRRETATKVGVPTPVEVGDGDIAPDLAATFLPLSTDRFRLRVDRALFETSPLPVSVEATAKDPRGTLPRQRLAFGYDARASRAPQSFDTEIAVGEPAGEPDATTLAIDYETGGAATTMDVIGGLYNGTPGRRSDPVGARLGYTPVPPKAGIDLVIGRRLALRKETVSPTRLTVDAEMVEGARERRAHAVLDRLPSWIELTHERLGEDRRKVTYAAAAPVGHFAFDYSDRAGGVLARAATVKAERLPTGMVLEQTSAKAGTFQASGGSLGSVEVGYAENGAPRLLRGATTPYGYVLEDGQLRSYAGRVDGLTRASFDGSGPIVVDAEIAARTPFAFKVDTPDLKADGDLADLPRHVRASVDLSAGRIDYDGFGDTIDRITLADASKPTGFFPGASKPLNRITHIEGTIRELPSKVTVTLKPGSQEGAGFTASEPIGSIEALLSSDPNATIADSGLPADESGFRVRDLPDRATAFGRIKGLKEVNLVSAESGRLTARAKVARQKLRAIYESVLPEAGQTTIDARLSEIPDDITVVVDPQDGRIRVAGSAAIEQVVGELTSSQPLFGRVRYARLVANGIPNPLDLTAKQVAVKRLVGGEETVVGRGVGARVNAPIRSLEALLASDPTVALPGGLKDGRQGASVVDKTSHFAALARVRDLKVLRAIGGKANELQLEHAAGPFDFRAEDDGRTVRAEIEDVPAKLNAAFDTDSGLLHLESPAPAGQPQPNVDRVLIELDSKQPLVGAAKLLRTTISGVPLPIEMTFPKRDDAKAVIGASRPLRRVDVLLTSGPELDVGGDPRNFDESRVSARVLDALPERPEEFVVVARVNGFKQLRYQGTGVTSVGLDLAAPQLLNVHAERDVAGDAIHKIGTVDLTADNLPATFDASLYDDRFSWDASEEIKSVSLSAENLPGKKASHAPHFVEGRVWGVPARFDVGFSEVFGYGLTSAFRQPSGPIRELQLDVADKKMDERRAPSFRGNTVLFSTRASNWGASARVFDVKRAEGKSSEFAGEEGHVAFGSAPAPVHIEHQTEDGQTTVDVPQPPQWIDVESYIGKDGGAEAVDFEYKAQAEFPSLSLKHLSNKLEAEAVIKDLPAEARLCQSESQFGSRCGHDAPDHYNVDPGLGKAITPITHPNDQTVALEMKARSDGRPLHLERLTVCQDKPMESAKGCLEERPQLARSGGGGFYLINPPTHKGLWIEDLRTQGFQFEYGDGDSLERRGDDPVEDDLLKAYLRTKELRIGSLLSVTDPKRPRWLGVQAAGLHTGDARREDVFRAWDTTEPPSYEMAFGTLTCGPLRISKQPLFREIDLEPILAPCGTRYYEQKP